MKKLAANILMSFALLHCIQAADAPTDNPLRHQVSVQVIQVALDDGSQPAPSFDPILHSEMAMVLKSIYRAYGIDMFFMPCVIRWNNTTAYQGDSVMYMEGKRPQFDLISHIVFGAQNHNVVSMHSTTLNVFFVGVCPDQRPGALGGSAIIGDNGAAIHLEATMMTNQPALAAHYLAHEIGHNLGLYHVSNPGNLMNPGAEASKIELLPEQIAALTATNLISTQFAHILPGGTGFTKPDTDGDGLTDEYELNQGLNPLDPDDAIQDRDYDGSSNLDEYFAGTDPNSASSSLAIVAVRIAIEGAVISFRTLPCRQYLLELATGSLGQEWAPLGSVAGTGDTVSLIDTSARGSNASFYRLTLLY